MFKSPEDNPVKDSSLPSSARTGKLRNVRNLSYPNLKLITCCSIDYFVDTILTADLQAIH